MADIEDLLKDLQDEDSSVRGEAIEALGEAGAKDAVEPLIAILKADEDEENRQLAAVALGDIRDERAIGALIEALDDEGLETIREDWGPFTKPSHYAAIALERFGMKAVEPLIEAFESREFDDVKLYIATSLGKMGYTRAVSSLKNALLEAPSGPDEVIREAISAITGQDNSEEDEDE